MDSPRESFFGQNYGLIGLSVFLTYLFIISVTQSSKNNTREKVLKIITYPDGITPEDFATLSNEAYSLASKGKVEVAEIIGENADTLSIKFKNPGDGFVRGPDGKYILRLRDTHTLKKIKPGEKVPIGADGFNGTSYVEKKFQK